MLSFLKNLAIAALAVFAPIKALLITVVFLLLSDFVTGILCALKKKEKITSKRMKRKLGIDLPLYLLAIMACYLFQINFFPDWELAKIVATLISIPELKSLLENIEILTGKPLFETIKKVLESKSSK